QGISSPGAKAECAIGRQRPCGSGAPQPLASAYGEGDHGAKRREGRVRASVPVKNRRRLLCVFPHYTPAFGTFNHAYRLMKGVHAFMPPHVLLVIAAYMPPPFPGRVID